MTSENFNADRSPLGFLESSVLSENRSNVLQTAGVTNHEQIYRLGLQLLANTKWTGGPNWGKFINWFGNTFGHGYNYYELLYMQMLGNYDAQKGKDDKILKEIRSGLGYAPSYRRDGTISSWPSSLCHYKNTDLYKPPPVQYKRGWEYNPRVFKSPKSSGHYSSQLETEKYGTDANFWKNEIPKLMLKILQGQPNYYNSSTTSNYPSINYMNAQLLACVMPTLWKNHKSIVKRLLSNIMGQRSFIYGAAFKEMFDTRMVDIVAEQDKSYKDNCVTSKTRLDDDVKRLRTQLTQQLQSAGSNQAKKLSIKNRQEDLIKQRQVRYDNELKNHHKTRYNSIRSYFESLLNIYGSQLPEDFLLRILKKYPTYLYQSDVFIRFLFAKFAPPDYVTPDSIYLTEQITYLTQMLSFIKESIPKVAFSTEQCPNSRINYENFALVLEYNIFCIKWKFQNHLDKSAILAYIQTPSTCNVLASAVRNSTSISPYRGYSNISSWVKNVDSSEERKIINQYLDAVFSLPSCKSPEDYLPYLDRRYCLDTFVTSKIWRETGDPAKWLKWLNFKPPTKTTSKVNETTFLASIQKSKIFELVSNNRLYFDADDKISITISLQGVGNVAVNIFEINTVSYFKAKKSAITTSIDIDGLKPNYTTVISKTSGGDNANNSLESSSAAASQTETDLPHIRRMYTFTFPPEMEKTRGIFIAEFIAHGQSCRALICKGGLRFVEKPTMAGHSFTILDEKNRVLPNASIWIDGASYKPLPSSTSNEIIVPFASSSRSRKILVIDPSGSYAELNDWTQQAESYDLECGFVLDRQQMIRDTNSTIIIRPTLYCNNEAASLKLLQEVTLTVSMRDKDGINSTKTVPDFKLSDTKESVYNCRIPENITYISVNLTCQVTPTQSTTPVKFNKNRTFNNLNPYFSASSWVTPHLRYNNNGNVEIHLVGATGEPVPYQNCNISFNSELFTNRFSCSLTSDSSGIIHMGRLWGIKTLTCSFSIDHGVSSGDSRNTTWTLLDRDIIKAQLPTTLTGQANDKASSDSATAPNVIVPMGKRTAFSEMLLMKICRGHWSKDYTSSLKYSSRTNTVAVTGLTEPGQYIVIYPRDNAHSCTIHIAPASAPKSNGWILGPQLLQQQDRIPLVISRVETNHQDYLLIHTSRRTANTRLHVVSSSIHPQYPLDAPTSLSTWPSPRLVTLSRPKCAYLNGRILSQEYRYIIERRNAARLGNMNAYPSLLLNPWARSDTDTATQTAKGGTSFADRSLGGGRSSTSSSRLSAAVSTTSDLGGYDPFSTSVVLANIPVPVDCCVQIPWSKLGDLNNIIQISCVDDLHSSSTSLLNPKAKPEGIDTNKDLRLGTKAMMDPTAHLVETRAYHPVSANKVLPVPGLKGAMAVYEKMSTLIKLFETQNNNSTFAEFSPFLGKWGTFSEKEKLAKYSKYACHELHIFIYFRDRPFFESKIRPFLLHKMDRQLIDYFFLEQWDKCAEFCTLSRFEKLNWFEKCILFMASKKAPSIVPSFDLVAMMEDQKTTLGNRASLFDKLFTTALNTARLDSDDAQEAAQAQRKAKAAREAKEREQQQNQRQEKRREEEKKPSKSLFGKKAKKKKKSKPRSSAGRGGRRGPSAPSAAMGMSASAMPMAPPRSMAPAPSMRRSKKKSMAPMMKMKAMEMEEEMEDDDEDECMAFDDFEPEPSESKDEMDFALDGLISEEVSVSANFDEQMKLRKTVVQKSFQQIGKTKEWAETHYYKTRLDSDTRHRVPLNEYWMDFAKWIAEGKSSNWSKPFLSPNVLFAAGGSFTEQVFALGVMSLSFVNAFELKTSGGQVQVISPGPMLAYYRDLSATAKPNLDTRIKLEQWVFDSQYPTHKNLDDNTQRPLKLTERFQFNRIYGCKVRIEALENLGSSQTFDVLLQIPQGAIPLRSGFYSKTLPITVGSSKGASTETNFFFYWPMVGNFKQFPAHASLNNKLVAFAPPQVFDVTMVPKSWPAPPKAPPPNPVDKTTWEYISQEGSIQQVIDYIKKNNLFTLNLSYILFRGRDKPQWKKIVSHFKSIFYWYQNIWVYAFYHLDADGIKDFISDNTRANRWSELSRIQYIETYLYSTSPRIKKYYEHLEYLPLINARSHTLGQQRQILNAKLKEQYRAFLDFSSRKSHLTATDLLIATHFLLVQDRVAEARDCFERIQTLPGDAEGASLRNLPPIDNDGRPKLGGTFPNVSLEEKNYNATLPLGPSAPKDSPRYFDVQMQYDYFQAYFDFSNVHHIETGQVPPVAEKLVAKWVNSCAVPRWAKKWDEMKSQLDEIRSLNAPKVAPTAIPIKAVEPVVDEPDLPDPSKPEPTRQELVRKWVSREPSLDVRVVDTTLEFDYQNLKSIVLNFYKMDLELLFSTKPFIMMENLQSSGGNAMFIMPNTTTTVTLDPSKETMTWHLPEDIKSENMAIQVTTLSGITKNVNYFANSLKVNVQEHMGQIQVLSRETGKPLPKAYIKVYAKRGGTDSKFYKDCYTDLRGRADYVSVSDQSIPLNQITKFALAVFTKAHGSLLRTATPPKQ